VDLLDDQAEYAIGVRRASVVARRIADLSSAARRRAEVPNIVVASFMVERITTN